MPRVTSLTLAALLVAPLSAMHAADVANLRCEYLDNPLGVDTPRPRLSWKLETGDLKPERGIKQTAFQILVASSGELLKKDKGDLWDSGKVASDRAVAIPYGGPALESGNTCHWRVRVWDGQGAVSPWSETARWTMGLLKPEDWSAHWIGAPAASPGTNLEGVVISRATYRTLDGKVAVDVTPVLKKALNEKRIPFTSISTTLAAILRRTWSRNWWWNTPVTANPKYRVRRTSAIWASPTPPLEFPRRGSAASSI